MVNRSGVLGDGRVQGQISRFEKSVWGGSIDGHIIFRSLREVSIFSMCRASIIDQGKLFIRHEIGKVDISNYEIAIVFINALEIHVVGVLIPSRVKFLFCVLRSAKEASTFLVVIRIQECKVEVVHRRLAIALKPFLGRFFPKVTIR